MGLLSVTVQNKTNMIIFMKQFSKCLYMLTLSLMVMQGAWAQINYIERSWDATSNTVTNTEKSITGSNVGYDASPSEGQYKVVTGNSETWFRMGGYNNSIEEYYVVNGTVNLRNIVVLGDNVHLILCDNAKLTLTAGLKLEDDHKLYIHSQSYDSNMGQLIVTNSYERAAGIGSAQNDGAEKVVGELVIHGGHIEATGGKYGAGIGSCARVQYKDAALCNSVTIYGGYVKATGGTNSAGIGGGCGFTNQGVNGGTFTLYDGTVIALGGKYAAGVGGGGSYAPTVDNLANGGYGGTVNIYGGELTATGGSDGAGIGSGNREYDSRSGDDESICGGTVNIYGGTVTAQGGDYAAGIGGGDFCGGAVVTISGGTVTATGGKAGAGIGGGEDAMGGNLTVSGGTVYAYGTDDGAGIGGGEDGKGGNVTITGGTVYAKAGLQSGSGHRAIGPGCGNDDYGTLSIGDIMTVYASNDNSLENHYSADDRKAACWYRTYAKIEPCTHIGSTYTINGTNIGDTHTRHCGYCTTPFQPERHTFDDDGKCTVCGVKSSTMLVTIYMPDLQKGGYMEMNFHMVNGDRFNLPGCNAIPAGLEFAGWLVNASSVPTDYLTTEGETLLPKGSEYEITSDVSFTARFRKININFADTENNDEKIHTYDGRIATSVTLTGRTLYKDGGWNTLCLPFALTAEQVSAQLAPAKLMTLDSSDFNQGTLTLNFVDATTIEAGKPYVIKWEKAADYEDTNEFNLYEPTFTDVIINENTIEVETDYADFVGIFSPRDIYTEEKTNLYLGSNGYLYYPWDDGMTSFDVNSFRAYFRLKKDLVAGDPIDPVSGINNFVLNFSGESSSIENIPSSIFNLQSEGWYTLDGRKLSGKPTQKGIYINNGKKVVISHL